MADAEPEAFTSKVIAREIEHFSTLATEIQKKYKDLDELGFLNVFGYVLIIVAVLLSSVSIGDDSTSILGFFGFSAGLPLSVSICALAVGFLMIALATIRKMFANWLSLQVDQIRINAERDEIYAKLDFQFRMAKEALDQKPEKKLHRPPIDP